MAELGRLDCRAAPPRRALSDDAKARAKAKRKAAYIPVDVSARFDWSKFELPNPIKIFGKDDVVKWRALLKTDRVTVAAIWLWWFWRARRCVLRRSVTTA